jgi:phospholipase C
MRTHPASFALCAGLFTAACGDDAPSGTTTSSSGNGGDGPVATPIEHVIVIVKENHTFDNYFGAFPGAEGTQVCPIGGQSVPCPKAPDVTKRDLCHSHECALTDWNDGQMDGWDGVAGSTMNGDGLAWSQYDEAGIPSYWAYARTFTLADHFFANVLAPSFPGHMFLLAAQAHWAYSNPKDDKDHPYWGCDEEPNDTLSVLAGGSCTTEKVRPCFKIKSLPDVLPAGVTWKFYGSTVETNTEVWSMFNGIDGIRNGPGWANVVTTDQLVADLENDALPSVAWVVDELHSDEHPGWGSVCSGENWTVGFVNQLMASKFWSNTVIFLTMDDFGGWYDHVPPPRQYGCDADHPYGLGFRLPLVIMSPYAKPGFVFKEQAEQASIPRFIEKVFGAPPLSRFDAAAQDGQANDLMNAFDWKQAPLPPLMREPRVCP